MAGERLVAVVGARALPEAWAARIGGVVGWFLEREWGITSGGAQGADQYALQAVIGAGATACQRSVVFLPGPVAATPRGPLGAFIGLGGRVVPGLGRGRVGLLARSRRLVQASAGVAAFLWGPSRGTVFTVREAVRLHRAVAVVLAGGGAELPVFPGGGWERFRLAGLPGYRWVPRVPAPRREPVAAALPPAAPSLARIFAVPEGEPTGAVLGHISALSQGERLWFEQGVRAGDTVVVPHEVLSDTPAWLMVPALRRRFGCGVREAAALGELFLALEADGATVAHYVAEARRVGVEAVIEDVAQLVARVAVVEPVADGDALDHATRLGEWDGAVAGGDDAGVVTGRGAIPVAALESASPVVGWHAVGRVRAERARCPGCGARYVVDEEAVDLPRCPACGMADTWEARQGAAFRALVAEVDGCPTLEALAAVGRRLYGLGLPREQAGVVWSHYRLRKAALEAAVALGAAARALVAEIEAAPVAAVARLGAKLYRLQRSGAVRLGVAEWRRVWRAYQARRGAAA